MHGRIREYAELKKGIWNDKKTIKRLTASLDNVRPVNAYVTDVVTHGSRGKKPLKITVIRGYGDRSREVKINDRIATRFSHMLFLKKKLAEREPEVERIVRKVEDEKLRAILTARLFDGGERLLTWQEVAKITGQTAAACQKAFERFIT